LTEVNERVSVGRYRMIRAAKTLMVTAALSLVVVASSSADTAGEYTLLNAGNCGGTCNLRGTFADIQAPSSMTIPSGSSAYVDVDGVTFGVSQNHFVSSGFLLLKNNPNFGCGGVSTTNGTIRGYSDAYYHSGGSNIYDCVLAGSSAGETHSHKVQRKADSLCPSGATPYCVAAYNDGTLELQHHLDSSTMDEIQAGDNISGSNGGSGTVVKGTFPGSGSQLWARTSDIHSAPNDTTWTTIQSANCNGDSGTWFIGSLSGGFQDYFNPGTGCQ
jgi:hypothetical protein